MDISIVIPTNQIDRRLKLALEAIECQQFDGSYEVIVVSDGRKERPRFVSMSVKWVVPPKKNRGPAYCRNLGVSEAVGNVVLFIDADICMTPELISRHFSFHEKTKRESVLIGLRSRIAHCHWVNADTHMNLCKLPLLTDIRLPAFQNGDWTSHSWGFFNTCHVSVPKNILEENEGFDENFIGWGVEDVELGYRLLKAEVSFNFTTAFVLHLDAKEERLTRYGTRFDVVEKKKKDGFRNALLFIGKYKEDKNVSNLVSKWMLLNGINF
jgi:glycosyltransferase involved in cell wall biosynthesis